MKKRIIATLISAVMMLGLMPVSYAAVQENTVNLQTNYDPYTKTTARECYAYANYDDMPQSSLKLDGDGGSVGSGQTNNYLVYKNMNFGTKGAVKLMVGMAHDGNGGTKHLSFHKGSVNGPVLATVYSQNTGNWNTPTDVTVDIPDPSLLTGTFDLYIKWNSSFGNLFYFQFDWKYENVEAPALAMLNGSSATTVIADATTLNASAGVTKQSDAATDNAVLVLTEYDSRGSMIKATFDAKDVNNNGVRTSYTISKTKETGTSTIGTYFWHKNGREIYSDGINKPGDYASSQTPSTSAIDVVANNGTVIISGSGAQDDRLIVAVVPTAYNQNNPIYSQAVQLYELPATDGKFYYSYRMKSDVPTGKYRAFVMGENTLLEKEFNYTSPNDIYSVLDYIDDTSKSASDVIDKIKNSADLFGAKAEFFDNMSDFDKTTINTAVQAFFASNPLSEIDVYTLWTDGLTDIILPQALISKLKTTTDASYAVGILDTYHSALGITSTPKYQDYKNGNKAKIASALLNGISRDCVLTGFGAEFDEAVIVGYFNAAASWGYIDEAIKAYYADITIDLTVYSRLINAAKTDFCNSFLNQSFTDKLAIKGLFEQLIPVYNRPEFTVEDKYEMEIIPVSDEIYRYEVFVEDTEDPRDNLPVFDDLDSVPWARSSIISMRYQGYVNGKSDTKFAPNDNITREEFTAILVRTFGLGTAPVDTLEFADVDKSAWYAPYIAAAKNSGVINGISDNTFGVGQNITREQIAAMLQRVVDSTGKTIIPQKTLAAFTDSAYISTYAYPAVIELAKANIINGVGKDEFAPKKSATRAEAVVMTSRLLKNIK